MEREGVTMNKIKLIFGIVYLAISLTPHTAKADKFNDFQLNRLHNPSEHQYLAESKGKIYIYDGLTSNQVSTALDNHFERIDSMMFTRIVQTNMQGEQYAENDGCD